jgi:hypothetical protein
MILVSMSANGNNGAGETSSVSCARGFKLLSSAEYKISSREAALVKPEVKR